MTSIFRAQHTGPPGAGHRPRPLMAVLLGLSIVLLAFLGTTRSADAHAQLKSSSPSNADIIATMPSSISASYTERLDRNESRLALYDSTGRKIDGTSIQPGSDDYTMVMSVPSGLPNGTYSVLWHTLSNDDGHTAEGYFAFTVGSAADVTAVVTIPTDTVGGGAPQILQSASRWLALIGFAAFLATWPIWTIVIRPALAPVWHDGPAFTRRMRRYALISFILAMVGSTSALLVQAMSLSEGTYFDKVMNTIGQTRFGNLWLLRIGLIALEGLILCACAWWFVRHRKVERVAAWAVALAMPLPFSLIAHASAQPVGRAFAIAADMVHLLAASVWIGGIFILATVLFPLTRALAPAQRRQVLIVAIPRFSLLALIAWAVLGLSGFYAGWLQVGNLHGLTTTPYGKSLLVKLILLVAILIVASINLFVIERHLNRKLTDAQTTIWSKRLTWTVVTELVLVLGVLGAIGQMTSQEPARDVLIERSKQISVSYADTNPRARLLLAPGIAGVNHFRLEIGGETLPTDTQAVLRLTMPDNSDLGTKEIQLARVAGNAFEYHGSDLGITGVWQIQMILREPDKAQIEGVATTTIATTAPKVDVPGTPWRFKTSGGITGLALILIGLGTGIFAIFQTRGRQRKETGGLGVAALILGCVLLLQARVDPILAVAAGDGAIDPNDVAMVERGKDVYTTNCLSCHGADLRGDGPQAAGLQPPPADFSQPHTMVHSDSDMVYWIEHGKQGTAMPDFGGILSDQDIRDVMAYIKNEQASVGNVATIPQPSDCTVQPRELSDLETLVGTTNDAVPAAAEAPPSPPVQIASDPAVDTQTQSEIIQTAEQMVACTNAVDTMRRLALFSDGNLKASFPHGVTPSFEQMATQPVTPLPQTRWMALLDVQNISMLSDGRISATVLIDDPTNHIHPAIVPGATPPAIDAYAQKATIIFVKVGDRWLIDAIQ